MSLILSEEKHGVAILTLNHVEKRNALTTALLNEISASLQQLEQDGCRAVILRALPGSKVWSAGHSLDELPEDGHDPLSWKDPLRRTIRDIENFSAPVIALIEGTVWGGACELVFACDLIVATPDSAFAATPAKLGVPYNATGLLTFLNTVHLHIAKEMLFTAQEIPSTRLAQYGVINRIVENETIESVCVEIGQTIVNNAPLAVAVMKEQLRILSGARAMSPNDFERVQSLRRVAYKSEDYSEGIHAVREHRRPNFHGQ